MISTEELYGLKMSAHSSVFNFLHFSIMFVKNIKHLDLSKNMFFLVCVCLFIQYRASHSRPQPERVLVTEVNFPFFFPIDIL